MPRTSPRGIDFILARVEKADKDSLYLTEVRNTQLQSKIGPYVDTFLAQLVMAELKGKMPEAKSEKRLLACFDKTLGKIAKHQKADGNFLGNEPGRPPCRWRCAARASTAPPRWASRCPASAGPGPEGVNTAGLDVAKGTFAASAGSGLVRWELAAAGAQRCRRANLQSVRQNVGPAGSGQHPQEGREEEPGRSSRARPHSRRPSSKRSWSWAG